jgi:AraC family transcriptional regulator of adaptative response / DNA-3-methyladenine glycosylase II
MRQGASINTNTNTNTNTNINLSTGLAAGSSRSRLFWRPPLDTQAMLVFHAQHQLPGMERVDMAALSLTRSLRLEAGGAVHRGWLHAWFRPEASAVDVTVSEGLQAVLPLVLWRVRALFDLDAEPHAINATLNADFPGGEGLRVPGCVDGFELAVRAVLGQQITVAAARTLAQRLLERFGEAIETPEPLVHRLFPTPQALLAAHSDELGAIGIVRQRQAAIQGLARGVTDGSLDLTGHADLAQTLDRLQSIPGIGPWTAQYIAMRALRWPDAWLVGDVAVHLALGLSPLRGTPTNRAATQRALAWQPWRSYAVIRAWAGHHTPAEQEHPP